MGSKVHCSIPLPSMPQSRQAQILQKPTPQTKHAVSPGAPRTQSPLPRNDNGRGCYAGGACRGLVEGTRAE